MWIFSNIVRSYVQRNEASKKLNHAYIRNAVIIQIQMTQVAHFLQRINILNPILF